MRKLVLAALAAGILSIVAIAIAAAHDDHSTGEWPTSCIDLNDIVEEHLGRTGNVGIYQRTFGDQAEAACRNDHRNDVRSVFAWAISDSPSQPSTNSLQVLGEKPPSGPNPELELRQVLSASGTGAGFTEPFYLRAGRYRITATIENNHANGQTQLFRVDLNTHSTSEYGAVLYYEIVNRFVREVEEETTIREWDDEAKYFEIMATGNWTVSIERIQE